METFILSASRMAALLLENGMLGGYEVIALRGFLVDKSLA